MGDTVINLQFTTFTVPLPDFIYDGIKEYCRNANGYQPQPQILVDRLAAKHAIPKGMIYLTAGADEAINAFALAYGKQTYIFTPTYIVYDGMKHFYAHVTAIDSLHNNAYTIPTDTIPDATLIVLANPNNPCGFTTREKVIELIQHNPQAIVVIDEVYAEFSDLSVLAETKRFKNLAVLRSFSKSYGMAAARVAYITAHPEVIAAIQNKTQWANVSYLSIGAAMSALNHEEYFTNLISDIISRRDDFIRYLNTGGFTVLPSRINAVLIRFETTKEGTLFAEYLQNQKFIVSHGNGHSNVGLDARFVRISIGTEEEMRAIHTAITQYHLKQP